MRPATLIFMFILLACTAPLAAQPQQKAKWPPSPHIAATDALRPEEQIKKIKLPPGFELQLVAADPDIRKPININFDAAGRLWITETIEYPFAAPPGKGRDAVKILEDFGPDGRARKITTFADKLNIPIGVIPDTNGKGALVYSIPAIQHMIDTRGAGKADVREVLYGNFGVDDTHGMTGEFQMGFDGWIYACHGFRNRSTVKSRGDTSITMESGNTYRLKPDGSKIEQWTWGQVNPFGLAFDPYGNLYSGDCHSQPLTMLLRHGWYVSFARPHDGLGFAPHMNTFGSQHSTALCGVAYYAADQYPEEYRDRLFLGDVVTNKINSYQIEWNGASPKAVVKEFLTSSDPWFRPVDIKLGPDGCLYFADFYNRIIGHYEVDLKHPGRDRDKGRIWRIVYRGKDGTKGPQPVVNLTKADVKSLVQALGHPNLTVRLQATHQLVERGGKEAALALQPIIKNVCFEGDGAKKVHALWTLERLGQLHDDELAVASGSMEKVVRVHAQRILTEKARWTPKYAAIAKLGLDDKEPIVQRVAAEAMAAHPSPDQVKPLVERLQRIPATDTHLTYAVRLALREQLRDEAAWKSLKLADWLQGEQRGVASVCPGVHNAQSAEFLKGYVERFVDNSAEAREHARYIVRQGNDRSLSWAVAFAEKKYAGAQARAIFLKPVLQAAQEKGIALSKEDRAKVEEVAVRAINDYPIGKSVPEGIDLAEMLKVKDALPSLVGMACNVKADVGTRKTSIKAITNIDAKLGAGMLQRFIMDNQYEAKYRGNVARDLGATNHPEAHAVLLKAFETAPARMETDLATGMTGNKAGCDKLLAAIDVGKAPFSALSSRPVVLNFQAAKVDLDGWLKKRGKTAPALDQKTQEAIAKRRDAFVSFKSDTAEGQKVFQKHCANCHQIANQGAKVGPNLDGVGTRGLERLLEDVLDPNRNVDQAFRTTIVTTKQGQTISGLFLREEGNVIIVADKDGKDQRIEKGQIDERALSPLSPMPNNFLETLSEPELHHLVAYLLNQRAKDK